MASQKRIGLERRSAYIAGPMRGYPEYNFPAFAAKAAELRDQGWLVHSPAERDEGDAEALRVMEEARKSGDWHVANPLAYYMQFDLPIVAGVDAIFLLDGWEASEGARLEVMVALALDKSVFEPDGKLVRSIPAQPQQHALPTDSEARKGIPITTGVLDYFPAAIAEVAAVSEAGNRKHNPGEPLHWARGKSMDQADCIARHLIERGGVDPDTGLRHTAQLAWRALALLQLELEEAGTPLARGAQAS